MSREPNKLLPSESAADELFPSRWEDPDPELLHRILTWWCDEVGTASAALYQTEGRGQALIAHVGEADFPAAYGAGSPRGFKSQLIAGGSLLFMPPEAWCPESERHELTLHLLSAALGIHRLQGRLKEQTFQAKYRGVELEALYELGLAISSTLDPDRLAEDVLLRAVSLLDARRGAFYEARGGEVVLRSVIGGRAAPSVPSERLSGVLEEGRARWVEEHTDAFGALPGAENCLVAPIFSSGAPRGLLVVGDKESRRGVGPFSPQDLQTLSLFAYQAAIAFENAHLHQQALEKERLDRDMKVAAQIQRQILPDRLPETPGYDVFGWNRPARQVGGDYYDVLTLANGRLVLVVADVSGKGMPAALMVSTLHSALRLMLDQTGVKRELLERLNRHILDLSLPNKFITLLLVEIEPESGRLRYLNAGHNPGLLVGPEGETTRLVAGGLPLGLLPSSQYRMSELQLEMGALLCLYSDGITECASPEGDEFGEQRLADFLLQRIDQGLPELERDLDAACIRFARDEPQGDDQTVVLLRRSPEGLPQELPRIPAP